MDIRKHSIPLRVIHFNYMIVIFTVSFGIELQQSITRLENKTNPHITCRDDISRIRDPCRPADATDRTRGRRNYRAVQRRKGS